MISTLIKLKMFFCFIFFSFFGSLIYSQDLNEYSLEASVKINSIAKTTQDLLQVYRELGANPQQVAVPFVFLSFLGHPNYPAFVPESNVCIFVYSSSHVCKRKYIIVAKLAEGSNIQKILERVGGNSEVHSGWTFFTKKKEDFAFIKDKEALLAYVNERSNNDIEITTKPSIVSCTKFSEDKNLKTVLNNIDKAQVSINILDKQVDVTSNFFYNRAGIDFSGWLTKYANKPGIVTKILSSNQKETKVSFLIDRKELSNLCNQLREYTNSISAK